MFNRNNQETETIKVRFYCHCNEEVKELSFQIVKGSNDGKTVSEQEVFCPGCDDERLLLEIPGEIPNQQKDAISRGGLFD